MKKILTLSPIALAFLLGACSRGDDGAAAPPAEVTDKFAAGHFLQFFNKQYSLEAGDYRVIVAPATGGTTGRYTVLAAQDDGSGDSYTGDWTTGASGDPLDIDNPSHDLTMVLPGGLAATLSASAAACFYLVDRTDAIRARAGDADETTAACDAGTLAGAFDLPRSQTNSEDYARAFYATVDSADARATLEDWRTTNGFDAGFDVHVIFRDTKDLGYGRDMFARQNTDQCGITTYAFMVQNFQVKAVPGQNYGPLNLDAAIAQDYRYHIGTNAIEWGPLDSDADGFPDEDPTCADPASVRRYTRHYTFDPGPVQTRRLMVDLDGKGPKAMPVPCILCHGGRADPLLPDGSFPRGGDTFARLQALDAGSFEFATAPGRTLAEQQAGIKFVNQAVYESYAANETPPNGEWDSSMAREMLESWYGGAGLPNDAFADSYVPAGWLPDPNDGSPPAGADLLYREVVAQNCRTCHLLRGINHENDLDFTSWEKFVSYAPEIEVNVFDKGVMPLSAITFDSFFESDGLAELLGSFLPGFSHYDANGALLTPGRPIAKAGPDRRSPSPVAVSGSASLFATSYQWQIESSPGGSVATLSGATTVRPTLTADTDGVYTLALTVSDGTVTSAADTVAITIDSAMSPAPKDLSFETHIKPVMQQASIGCTTCHAAATGVVPPVFWTDAGQEGNDLYTEVRARVDLMDPENSRLLLKPTGHHHNGGVRPGFDLEGAVDGDRSNYDLFLNWILEGAREQ